MYPDPAFVSVIAVTAPAVIVAVAAAEVPSVACGPEKLTVGALV